MPLFASNLPCMSTSWNIRAHFGLNQIYVSHQSVRNILIPQLDDANALWSLLLSACACVWAGDLIIFPGGSWKKSLNESLITQSKNIQWIPALCQIPKPHLMRQEVVVRQSDDDNNIKKKYLQRWRILRITQFILIYLRLHFAEVCFWCFSFCQD